MLTTITAIGGLLGLVASVGLLAWQTRAVAQQTRQGNALAGVSSIIELDTLLHEVLRQFVEHPELRTYFYDGTACPARGRRRAQVLTIADLLADALEAGLLATRLIRSNESQDDWTDYCRFMLASSDTLREVVLPHQQWWPALHRLAS